MFHPDSIHLVSMEHFRNCATGSNLKPAGFLWVGDEATMLHSRSNTLLSVWMPSLLWATLRLSLSKQFQALSGSCQPAVWPLTWLSTPRTGALIPPQGILFECSQTWNWLLVKTMKYFWVTWWVRKNVVFPWTSTVTRRVNLLKAVTQRSRSSGP